MLINYFERVAFEKQKNRLIRCYYDEKKFGPIAEDNYCAICYIEYSKNDKILQSKCMGGHFYHEKCLEPWLRQGKTNCPMCN